MNWVLTNIPHREYYLWQEWLDRQWNKPNRSDHYLMQIVAELRRLRMDRGRANSDSVSLHDFEIPFEIVSKNDESEEIDVKEESRRIRAMLLPMLGMKTTP